LKDLAEIKIIRPKATKIRISKNNSVIRKSPQNPKSQSQDTFVKSGLYG